jgi:hypothetical protein
LATFFGAQELPVDVIRQMLRHKDDKMALHYIHRVNSQQIAAQGLFLDAIRLSSRPN